MKNLLLLLIVLFPVLTFAQAGGSDEFKTGTNELVLDSIESISQGYQVLVRDTLDGKVKTAHLSMNHSELLELGFAESQHTGFEPEKGADDNFVTDAEKVIVSSISGTNTGDAEQLNVVTGGTTRTADWSDGDVITMYMQYTAMTLNIQNIPETKTTQIRIEQRDNEGGCILTLNLYSDGGTTLLTKKIFGANSDIDPTADSFTKIICQRFGSTIDLMYQYEN